MATTTQASVRVPNYTDAMVSRMVSAYSSNPTVSTVEVLARELGKTKRSITAKLVREGVYQAQERTTKAGTPIVRKAELVAQIESHFMGVSLPSLVKASKADLQRMVATIPSMV